MDMRGRAHRALSIVCPGLPGSASAHPQVAGPSTGVPGGAPGAHGRAQPGRMTHSTIALLTTEDLAVAGPLMLGYWPEGSVCAILVDSEHHVVLIMRWERDADVVLPAMPVAATDAGFPVAVHLVVFATVDGAPQPLDSKAWERSADALRECGLPLGRTLAVARTPEGVMWTSAEGPLHDPGVHLIPASAVADVAARWGLPMWRESRSDYVADIAPDPGARAEVDRVLMDLPPLMEAERDQAIMAIRALLSEACLSRAQVAQVLRGLTDVRVRDTVLWDLMQEGPHAWSTHADRLAEAVAAAPDGSVAPAATLLAILRWQLGDGSRAGAAVERALAADPGYSLAGLVDRCLAAGLHPATWRAGLDDLSRDSCRRAA